MDKAFKNEIRRLLTGRTLRDEDGWLVAVPEGSRLVYHGVVDNTAHRKIVSREEVFQAANDPDAAFHRVYEALQKIGLLVNLSSRPEALCAMRRYALTKTTILCVFPISGGRVRAEVYTGKSILAPLYCKRALAQLEKLLSA